MDYPLHFSGQLRQHLRALRKQRKMTQAMLGSVLGVGQARIAEIERNPGVVSVDQLMSILSALGATVVLRDASEPELEPSDTEHATKGQPSTGSRTQGKEYSATKPVRGQPDFVSMTAAKAFPPMPVPDRRADGKSPGVGEPSAEVNVHLKMRQTSQRNHVTLPKKGSW